MFGHDNQNDQQQNDTNTPVVSPSDNAAVSAPAFDTSSVSLDMNQAQPSAPAPSMSTDEPVVASAPEPEVAAPAPVADDNHLLSATNSHDDLLAIKQNALQQLSPLVDHLEQSAEEKFRTTMMMIQASDDQSLIQAAYDAAKQITDEKVRAQALLDIVNEINYFTQQASQE